MITRERIERIYVEVQPHFVRTKDIEGYAGLFTEDAVWWPMGRETRIGHRQIAEGFAQVMDGCRIEPVFEAMEVIVREDFGLAALHGVETIRFDNGDPTQVVRSREIWEFREVGGELKISRMIWNAVPGDAD
jgi:ketosteroid isomerase-like protein